ncbi:Protein of unknown function [Porphyromonadaceae bacterium NLAE-zl-C104]|uniref:DUF2752 domain-containing protein n=1 Tax=Proteiniphilum TaxID=294702 RepID=UPI00089A60AD|nr:MULTISPECIES: DUF2752 domain-containing protein [Proteiniphilum]MDY9918359.1 DUF2752 domain-containing protein [Proteiniphilum sp.]SDZ80167.1 Protein of unknown function [Porphyromonadaceae bacterium KH3R12]SFL03331.1 Protein of unknown function [Porphyromonadaceae bacterium KH3CP3RA]SFS96735.1 Protein of unknown function [Porphyromonadaceae bacterium NLAE-zl-C104]
MHKSVKIGIGAIAILLVAIALYIFYTFDPETQPLFPQCPFLLVTGHECPGCGSQRAIHSLLHLNIGAALRYNAFMLLALPYIFVGIYLEYFGGKKRHPRIEKFFFGRWSAIIVLVVIIAYWILRNIL